MASEHGWDLIIKGGTIIDGTGLPGFQADLGIRDGRIERIGRVAPDGSFICRKTGRPGNQMDRPPFKGALGEWIHQNISQETFQLWIAQGTKVINELRLDLSQDKDSDTYDAHMREFLGVDDAMYEEITGEKPRGSAVM